MDGSVGPQEQQFLSSVYRRTLQRLSLADRIDEPMCEIIAGKIIEIYKRGATNAIGISEIVIRELKSNATAPRPEQWPCLENPSGWAEYQPNPLLD
jgi:hypothetical protein